MKLQRGFANIVIILILVVIGGSALYFFAMPKVTNAPDVAVPRENPSETVQNNLDIPTDWETFSSDSYSFRYPKDGTKTDTGAAGEGIESIRVTYMGEKQIASGRTQTSIADGYMFVVTTRETDKSAKEYATEMRENSFENCGNPDAQISHLRSTKVASKNGFTYSVEGCFGSGNPIYVEHKGKVYEISRLATGEEPEVGVYKDTVEQIVSTLTFK